jgi:hypothetical protein
VLQAIQSNYHASEDKLKTHLHQSQAIDLHAYLLRTDACWKAGTDGKTATRKQTVQNPTKPCAVHNARRIPGRENNKNGPASPGLSNHHLACTISGYIFPES